jgi:hypothetical protein
MILALPKKEESEGKRRTSSLSVTQKEVPKYRSRLSLTGLGADSKLFSCTSLAFSVSGTSEVGRAPPLFATESAGVTPLFSVSRYLTRFSNLAILLRISPSGFRRPPCLLLGTREMADETQTTPLRKQLEQGFPRSHLILRRRHRSQLARVLAATAGVWLCSSEADEPGVSCGAVVELAP